MRDEQETIPDIQTVPSRAFGNHRVPQGWKALERSIVRKKKTGRGLNMAFISKGGEDHYVWEVFRFMVGPAERGHTRTFSRAVMEANEAFERFIEEK